MLTYSFLLYFYIKVHGLVAAHKKNIYEGTDFIQKAPKGVVYLSVAQPLTVFSLTAMRRGGTSLNILLFQFFLSKIYYDSK